MVVAKVETRDEVAKSVSTGRSERTVVKVGFDFGTNTSVICAAESGKDVELKQDMVLSVVGYPKPGLLPGILPRGKRVLFGEEAIQHRLHLNLKWPLIKGIVTDFEPAKDFMGHVRTVIDPDGAKEIWAVIGCPANSNSEKCHDLRTGCASAFSKVLIVPEPFLAAMGFRDESRLDDPTYVDPTRNSLFVDIGAGTTDFCMVQGFYPTSNEMASMNKAGNDIDTAITAAIRRKYPDWAVTAIRITRLKEQYSFVGEAPERIVVTELVGGKPRHLDITNEIKVGCDSLVDDVVKHIEEMASRCDTDAVETMLNNIILTGGGSLIRNLCEVIQAKLHGKGYTTARVRRVDDYKRLVAKGALKTAKAVRDDQWQIPV
ncbi:MAG: rod shape-determining protein [Planctomycetes bacterium]|nr:rod shape-determining protein [Planctomycetota bacterium]